jgi:hypothetical protein
MLTDEKTGAYPTARRLAEVGTAEGLAELDRAAAADNRWGRLGGAAVAVIVALVGWGVW